MNDTLFCNNNHKVDSRSSLAFEHPLLQLLFYGIVATIPFYRWRQLPGPDFMKIDWLLFGLLFVIITPNLLINKGTPRGLTSNIWLPLGLFLLFNFLAFLLSPYPDQAWDGMKVLLQASLFMCITMMMVTERGFESLLPVTLVLSMGLGALLSCIGYFGDVQFFNQEGEERAYGGSISANNMALMCVFSLPIAAFWGVHSRSTKMRLLGMAFFLLILMGVVSTVSRGGFLCALAICFLIALQYKCHFKPKHLGVLVAIISVSAIIITPNIPSDFFTRQATLITEGTQDRSLDRRSAYIEVAIDAVLQRPIAGWGTDTFKKIWANSFQARWFDMIERPAHNTYLEVAVGSGIIGLVAFIFLIVRAFLNYQQSQDALIKYGLEREAHLVGSFKLSLVSVAIYFLMKSGLEHKYFLLIIPLSEIAIRYAKQKISEANSLPETSQ